MSLEKNIAIEIGTIDPSQSDDSQKPTGDIEYDIDLIKRIIKDRSEFYHACMEKERKCLREISKGQEHLKLLRAIMRITKTYVYKLEELIKDEVR